jgi:hypothetical protein
MGVAYLATSIAGFSVLERSLHSSYRFLDPAQKPILEIGDGLASARMFLDARWGEQPMNFSAQAD